MEEFTLIVPSIGCQGCMKKIVTKLQSLPGIEIVQTDITAKSLVLRYSREEITSEQIKQAVRDIGHRLASGEPDPAGGRV